MVERRGRFFPEQGSRQPQRGMEGRGGIRLNITNAPILPSSSTITREPPTTQPHPDEQRLSPDTEPRKPKKGKVLRNLAIWFTSLTATGGAVYGAYQHVPAVHRMVDSLFPGHLRGDSLVPSETKIKPEAKFDNTARSGVIKTIKRISEEDTAKLDSFAKIDDHNTVLVIDPIDVGTSNKPDAKIKYKRGYENYSGNDKDLINLQEQGYFSNFRFETVPAESTIFSYVDGRLLLYREKDIANDHPFSKAVIEFQPREGEIFVISISGRSTNASMINPKDDVFRSLTDAPAYEYGTSQNILEVFEQAIPIKKGQPIMQAVKEINVSFDITFSARPNTDPSKLKIVGETIVNGQKRDVVQVPSTHVELFLSEDGEIVQPQLPTNHN